MEFKQQQCQPTASETVLDCLLRHGQDVSFSCKSGSCQSCLLKSLKGDVSPEAQRGLKPTHIEQGFFLSCQQPAKTIELACHVDEHALFGAARLLEKHFYNNEICRLRLEPSCALFYHAGQFINLKNANGISRSYSLASLPCEDPYLELHIRRKDHGEMSSWIFDEFNEGDFVDVQGPIGDCYYSSIKADMTMVLIGSGTGAAPLIGIARDAIKSAHKGDIHFYHGAREAEYLYLDDELEILQNKISNFYYHPCVGSEEAGDKYKIGLCNEVALSEMKDHSNTQLYLCGNPEMVTSTSKKAYLDGVSISNIHTDPFEYQELRKTPR